MTGIDETEQTGNKKRRGIELEHEWGVGPIREAWALFAAVEHCWRYHNNQDPELTPPPRAVLVQAWLHAIEDDLRRVQQGYRNFMQIVSLLRSELTRDDPDGVSIEPDGINLLDHAGRSLLRFAQGERHDATGVHDTFRVLVGCPLDEVLRTDGGPSHKMDEWYQGMAAYLNTTSYSSWLLAYETAADEYTGDHGVAA